MSAIIWIWILYVLSHDVSNALLHHVTPNCRKFIILGKAGSFSQKQVLACLMTQLLCQGHDSRMISIDQLKTYP